MGRKAFLPGGGNGAWLSPLHELGRGVAATHDPGGTPAPSALPPCRIIAGRKESLRAHSAAERTRIEPKKPGASLMLFLRSRRVALFRHLSSPFGYHRLLLAAPPRCASSRPTCLGNPAVRGGAHRSRPPPVRTPRSSRPARRGRWLPPRGSVIDPRHRSTDRCGRRPPAPRHQPEPRG